jgi:hypothetical protein
MDEMIPKEHRLRPYQFTLRGEDREVFTVEHAARSDNEAHDHIESNWPEAVILDFKELPS